MDQMAGMNARYGNRGLVDLSRYSTIGQDHAHDDTSGMYRFVPTSKVVAAMQDSGWNAVQVMEQRVVNKDREGFQKHMIRFRQGGEPIQVVRDVLFPEVVVTNDHGGRASILIMAGIWRIVCGNGAVVADSMFSTFRIPHVGYANDRVFEALSLINDQMPKVVARAGEWQGIMLNRDEQEAFAQSALVAKYGEEDVERRKFDTGMLLMPRRMQDREPSLWNTYNIVQEKMTKGSTYERNRKTGRGKKTVAITSITENVRVNQALWALTEKMAELKG